MYTNFHVHLFQSLKSTPFDQRYELTLLLTNLFNKISIHDKKNNSIPNNAKKKKKKKTIQSPQEIYPTNLKRLILSLIGSRRHRVNYSLEGIFSTSEATSTSQLRISSLTRFQGALMPPDY